MKKKHLTKSNAQMIKVFDHLGREENSLNLTKDTYENPQLAT
jgi:hypothetical protein